MNKLDLLYGFLIGIAACCVGTVVLILVFTHSGFLEGLRSLRSDGNLGKVISLGAVLNLFAFFLLLKYKKDIMARGVILATLVLTIVALTV